MNSTIHRSPKDKEHPFTSISNDIIDNNKLSAEARIILIKMLRNIDGYYYSIDGISHTTGLSIGKATRAIKELQDAGYLKITKSKTSGRGSGRGFIITYEIFENPIARISSIEDKVSNVEQPVTNTSQNNQPPATAEVISTEQFNFEQFWNKYPKKINHDAALKAFLSIPDVNTVFSDIMSALDIQIKSKQWGEEGGRYIPAPENYLKKQFWNNVVIRRYTDEEFLEMMEDWQ